MCLKLRLLEKYNKKSSSKVNPERPVKYVRKQINYAELDDIGHGIKIGSATMRQPKSASINSRNSSTISRSQSQIDERLVSFLVENDYEYLLQGSTGVSSGFKL